MEGPHSPEADARLALVERFFRDTGPAYDAIVNAATFGIDRRWKRTIVAVLPENPARVLDFACGTGTPRTNTQAAVGASHGS